MKLLYTCAWCGHKTEEPVIERFETEDGSAVEYSYCTDCYSKKRRFNNENGN